MTEDSTYRLKLRENQTVYRLASNAHDGVEYRIVSANAEHFEAGDIVETPDGLGFVDDKLTEGSVDGLDASSDSPIYAVGMVEEAGVNFYRGDELSEGELPETPVDEPVDDVAENGDGQTDNAVTANQFGDFDYPESWEEADVPARLILIDAWTSMGAQFDCAGGCCKQTMRESGMTERGSDQFCASMKDAVLGTHDWRGGWVD